MGADSHLALSKGVGVEDICASMIVDIDSEDYIDGYPEEEGSQDEDDD